jgi:hypothetical protein
VIARIVPDLANQWDPSRVVIEIISFKPATNQRFRDEFATRNASSVAAVVRPLAFIRAGSKIPVCGHFR